MNNPLDSLIGWFNPRAGLERAVARVRMEHVNGLRNYEGASRGRLSKGWRTSSAPADQQLSRDGQLLRDRSRDLVRNNPLAAKIVTTHANNLVGPGIVPRAKTGDAAKDKIIDDLFDEWSKVCNVAGTMDFHGTCYMLAREMVTGGEVFVRRRRRRAADGLPVPLQLQVLDSEFCDWHKTTMQGASTIINGIEFDQIGRRRGYWMHPNNPVGFWPTTSGSNVSAFVTADDIAHLFEPQANQNRGAPWLAPVITELREVKDYELAEGVRKKTEACLVGIVVPDETTDPNVSLTEENGPGGPALLDMQGNPVNRMEPGMFAVMRNGGDIKFNTPAISAGVEAYLRTRYRSIAAGARLPYELMTGDYSQANFASGQLGLIDYQRFSESIIWHYLIPQAMQRMWDWFIQAAREAGKIPLNLKVGVEWQPPEFERINRLDNARADLIEVRMGKRSMPEIIAKTGRNPTDVLKENDEFFQQVDKTTSQLVLDADPRKVSLNGQAQLFGAGTDGGGDSAPGK